MLELGLVSMCWPLLWGLHQMGHNIATFGALVGSLKGIMRMLNSQRLEDVVVASNLKSHRTLSWLQSLGHRNIPLYWQMRPRSAAPKVREKPAPKQAK